MHSRATVPDFSAFERTGTAAPAGQHQSGAAAGDSAEVPASHAGIGASAATSAGTAPGTVRDGDAGSKPARITAPPFSWLGHDAWPSFTAWADTPL